MIVVRSITFQHSSYVEFCLAPSSLAEKAKSLTSSVLYLPALCFGDSQMAMPALSIAEICLAFQFAGPQSLTQGKI